MAVTATQVQNLYLAYFGRPAEKAGLAYWTAQANATVDQISASFAQQPEYTASFGSLTRAQVVNQLYVNLFGRSAASNELNYWINSTDVTVDKLALALTNGATGTDRVLLDSKIQYATSITAASSATATGSTVKGSFTDSAATVTVNNAPLTLAQYTGTAANSTAVGTAAQFYTLAASQLANKSVFAINGSAVQDGNLGTAASVVFPDGTTSASIALNAATGTSTLTLGDASTVTGLTLAGTSGSATANGTPAATVINVTETGTTTDVLASLTLNVSGAATAASSTTVAITGTDALTTINASGSTAGLTIDASGLTSVTSLTGGSGNDTLTISSGSKAVTLNAGAGDDIVNLNGVAGTSATVNHVASLTLGAGNDTLNVTALSNLFGTFTLGTQSGLADANAAIANDLIKVTDFAAGDKLSIAGALSGANAGGSFVAQTAAQQTAVSAAATLADAANLAANNVAGATPASHSTAFQYNGNTYVFVDHAAAANIGAGDGLIELTGFTGALTSTNFATA